ncbi:putative DNA replication factor CDT1 like [Lyophyllum shimeji]|uniref:DNA replication factor CDT1 like n=1 Tax=Lyophyllum shimeji TaxID=47721 RepID=A0A9P3PFN2_LYOSH|nr:putative DNA replication factor CDT1 like [Lyophyllum shimeji]
MASDSNVASLYTTNPVYPGLQDMKRKSQEPTSAENRRSEAPRNKRQKAVGVSSSGKSKEATPWPDHFDELFKIFKALNTVLGFVSSRKQLATTFPVIRSSVEALLKQPLELVRVAELKALLPDLIKFSYIPRNDIRINEESISASKGLRERSPDNSTSCAASTSRIRLENEEEHVLVLEFIDNTRGKKTRNDSLVALPALQPAAVKKLIEKRNKIFQQAVDDFIVSIPVTDDPVNILQTAAQAHVPVKPNVSTVKSTEIKYTTVPDPSDRPTVDAIIAELKEQSWYKNQIIDRRTFEAREAQIASLEPPLSASISQALVDSSKISTLYSHQVAAIRAVTSNKHVIVSTSTASGKSVIYQVPVLRFLEDDASATAIFIYPTKALAQDQRGAMEKLISNCPGVQHLKVATYDGDTPQERRAEIRETASVIFTNFDMIHASILPHEDVWRRFLKNLKLLVVDELHCYSGLFGSHVALILRRLRRVCAAVGNRRTRFVSCSATISNPKAHMMNVFGINPDEIEAVTTDGAPSGRKDFLIWNPPYIDANEPSLGRHSSLSEATSLMRFLMKRGLRVILFCKIRKVCELAMKTLLAELSNEGRYDIVDRTMPYRGGYSREDRRRIEQDAFNGRLLGIVATNALELGVDIGALDAVIMLGFPLSIASFRQQAGRAGRRCRDSLAVLVADPFPIDQHYVAHPEQLFKSSGDDLIIDLDSRPLLEAHLQCAAQEMPLSADDHGYFGLLCKEVCETTLVKDHDGWYHTHPKFLPFPSKYISIRGAQEEKYAVVKVKKPGQAGVILEEIEVSRAMFEVYEGGVFMHQGMTFIVKEVSHDSKIAKVIPADVNWITSPRDFTNVDAVRTYRIKEIRDSPHRAYYGKVEVEVKVFGFFKIRNKVILESVDLDTPAWERDTTGLWMDVPKTLLQLFRTKQINPAEAIHSAQHAFLNRFSMAQDLRTECKAPEKEYKGTESQRKRPARLIFYDAIGKGGGVAAKAFDNVNEILRNAYEAIETCECDEGCYHCVLGPACRENNVVCSKLGAQLVLKAMLALRIDEQSISFQGDDRHELETVVEAQAVPAVGGVQVEAA